MIGPELASSRHRFTQMQVLWVDLHQEDVARIEHEPLAGQVRQVDPVQEMNLLDSGLAHVCGGHDMRRLKIAPELDSMMGLDNQRSSRLVLSAPPSRGAQSASTWMPVSPVEIEAPALTYRASIVNRRAACRTPLRTSKMLMLSGPFHTNAVPASTFPGETEEGPYSTPPPCPSRLTWSGIDIQQTDRVPSLGYDCDTALGIVIDQRIERVAIDRAVIVATRTEPLTSRLLLSERFELPPPDAIVA